MEKFVRSFVNLSQLEHRNVGGSVGRIRVACYYYSLDFAYKNFLRIFPKIYLFDLDRDSNLICSSLILDNMEVVGEQFQREILMPPSLTVAKPTQS